MSNETKPLALEDLALTRINSGDDYLDLTPPGQGSWVVCISRMEGDFTLEQAEQLARYIQDYAKYQAVLSALQEARQQIEYLHEKFGATGSGSQVLARIDAALADLTPK